VLFYIVSAICTVVVVIAMVCGGLGFYHLAVAFDEIRPEKRWWWLLGNGLPFFVPKGHFSTDDGKRHQQKGGLFVFACFLLIGLTMLAIELVGPLLH
jgi:hypothetical protein